METPGPRGRHEDGLPPAQHGTGVGACVQQQLDEGAVSAGARQRERRHTVSIARIHLGSGTNEQLGRLRVVVVGRPVAARSCHRPAGR